MTESVYLFDDIYLERAPDNRLMLFVGQPVESLLRFKALRECDPEAALKRSDALKAFLHDRAARRIQLADTSLRLQLGGGFLQIQGDHLFLVERDRLAPTQPNCLDLCSGVFDTAYSTPLEMMVAEASELLRLSDDGREVIFPTFSIGTCPLPENATLAREIDMIVGLLDRCSCSTRSTRTITAEIEAPPGSVRLVCDSFPEIPVRVSIEPASCSLEITGVARLHPGTFKYADGEIEQAQDDIKMLNRRVHEFSLSEHTHDVWQGFERVSSDRLGVRPMSLARMGHPPLTAKSQDIIGAVWARSRWSEKGGT